MFAGISVRFSSGTLVLASLKKSDGPPEPIVCTVAGHRQVARIELAASDVERLAETQAFVRAVCNGKRAPVTIDDVLAAARLVERIQATLR